MSTYSRKIIIFLLFFYYLFIYYFSGWIPGGCFLSYAQWPQSAAVGRSRAQCPPQWAAETAPPNMPIFG